MAPPPLARGLDIPAIKTVVNFDVSKDIDTHVHRIGRTGRAGEKGTAFTLVTSRDTQFSGDLVRNLVRGVAVGVVITRVNTSRLATISVNTPLSKWVCFQ